MVLVRARNFFVYIITSCTKQTFMALVSTKPRDWLGRCLRNDLFCVVWDTEPNSINLFIALNLAVYKEYPLPEYLENQLNFSHKNVLMINIMSLLTTTAQNISAYRSSQHGVSSNSITIGHMLVITHHWAYCMLTYHQQQTKWPVNLGQDYWTAVFWFKQFGFISTNISLLLSQKRCKIGRDSYYGRIIGTCMLSIEWHYFQWPWVTLYDFNQPHFPHLESHFHIFLVGGDRDYKFGRQVDNRKS